MRNPLYDIYLLVLFVVSAALGASIARAETIAATSSTPYVYSQYGGGTALSQAAACAASFAFAKQTLPAPYSAEEVVTSGGTYGYGFCRFYYGFNLNSTFVFHMQRSVSPPIYTCPEGQNWTLSGSQCTRPDCVSPQTRNPATGVCEAPACTSKAAVGADGYFDYGTNPAGAFPSVVCVGGCMAIFSGTAPAGSAVVNGVKRYYGYGGYDYAGGGASSVCTAGAGTPAPGESLAALPASHCAPDQIEGMINGKLNCWNTPGSGVAPVPAPVDAPVTKESTTSTSTVTVGDTVTTTNVTNHYGGGQTTVVTACTGGNCTSTTTETLPGSDPTEDAVGSPVAGSLGEVGELAQADERTFQSVWSARKAEIMATPLVGLASSLTSFPGATGACPSWSVSGSVFGQSIAGDISPPCWIWDVLRAFMLITTLFSARRLIFGG